MPALNCSISSPSRSKVQHKELTVSHKGSCEQKYTLDDNARIEQHPMDIHALHLKLKRTAAVLVVQSPSEATGRVA